MFFGNENNSKILGGFLRKVEASHVADEMLQNRLTLSKSIVSYMYKSPEGWDDRCSFNIKHIGDQFIRWLQDFEPENQTHINHIYVIAYRFLCEFDFFVGTGQELSMDLRSIKTKIEEDNYELDKDLQSQMVYASFFMPANIAKDFINDSNIGVLRDFENKKAEAEKLKDDWDNEITQKKSEVDALKDKLDKYKIGFNFVGLYQGFSELVDKKNKELLFLFISLIGMGTLVLAPLIIELTITSMWLMLGKTLGSSHLTILLPIISIEIILIYFFRVILLNYKSVKAQIMQLELRKTLCQFIQSYSEYSSGIKKQDANALEKFESLIFSGVISDPDNIPSTFDGLQQIGSLIKNIKNS